MALRRLTISACDRGKERPTERENRVTYCKGGKRTVNAVQTMYLNNTLRLLFAFKHVLNEVSELGTSVKDTEGGVAVKNQNRDHIKAPVSVGSFSAFTLSLCSLMQSYLLQLSSVSHSFYHFPLCTWFKKEM